MIIWGISSMYHDAALTVLDNNKILFAGHSERYSREKNDAFLNRKLINAGLDAGFPEVITLHETAWAKRLRCAYSRDWQGLREPTQTDWIRRFYPELRDVPIVNYWHHQTHAAAGVLTSKFDDCAVMVIDAIGEWDTASIWHWREGKLRKLHRVRYPHSLGLFYSAVTHRVGLKPNEDEYILMGMAAYGNPDRARQLSSEIDRDYFKSSASPMAGARAVLTRKNLHRGLSPSSFPGVDHFDLAWAAQDQVERRVIAYANYAKQLTGSDNLVFMGGVALNCVANSKLFDVFSNVHIMPNPGDAGSSLGAAALHLYNTSGKRVDWRGPYLGHNIPGAYPVSRALQSLAAGDIFGIANGRAEFGPRALGNRSLLADPRGGDIKERMNAIKQRQQFRPFAPVILEEQAHKYFDMPQKNLTSPYMQFVARCKYPQAFPAIIHADGTSRVQTVNQRQHPGLYMLLREFFKRTGCPMLVNTSLNIKGQPIVNTVEDAAAFAKHYGVNVHTHE